MSQLKTVDGTPIADADIDEYRDYLANCEAAIEEVLYWIQEYNCAVSEFNALNSKLWISPASSSIEGRNSDGYPVTLVGYQPEDDGRPLKYLVLWDKREPTPCKERRKTLTRTEIRQQIGLSQSWKCFYCNESGSEERGPDGRIWHVDHVYAKFLGGDDEPDNLVVSCATCNLKKNRKRVLDFLESFRSQEVSA